MASLLIYQGNTNRNSMKFTAFISLKLSKLQFIGWLNKSIKYLMIYENPFGIFLSRSEMLKDESLTHNLLLSLRIQNYAFRHTNELY